MYKALLAVGSCLTLHSLTAAEEWVRVVSCSEDAASPTWTPQVPNFQTLHALSDMATKVRICTTGSTTDCVESQANSFPILNLRQNVSSMSLISGVTPCNLNCARTFWTGPTRRINQLATNCRGQWGSNNVYQACGNARGLHITEGLCTWDYVCQLRPQTVDAAECENSRNLEVFINQVTYAPSSSPTARPTHLFEHPDLHGNISDLQAYVRNLESRLEAAENSLNSKADISAVNAQVSTLNDRATLLEEEIDAGQQALAANITLLQSNLSTIVGAFRTATASSSTGPSYHGPPSIDASDNMITVGAENSIRFQSGTCDVDDVCNIADFSGRLSDALAQALASL